MGNLILHRKQLLVLGLGRYENDFGLTVIENVGGLFSGVGGVDGHGNSPSRLDTEI